MKGSQSRPWSSQEDDVLRALYGKKNINEIAKKLNRSEQAIHHRAQKLNLRQDQRRQVTSLNTPVRSALISWGKWIFGIFVLWIGLVASIYQLYGGPPWPTAPTFTPQPPSGGSPFDNPFDVTNKSGLADLHDLAVTCRIIYLQSSRMTVARNANNLRLIFPAKGLAPILDAGSPPQQITCPFREYAEAVGWGASALDNPTEARISLFAEYKTPVWWPPTWFIGKQTTPETVFTLDTKTVPPRWTIPLY
jgi:hypothetical protein